MYGNVFLIFAVVLVVSMPMVSAQETHGIIDHAKMISYNIMSEIKVAVLGIEAWFIKYIIGDHATASRISFEIEKERAYNAFNNDRFRDENCCRSYTCYTEPTDACVSVCQNCNSVRIELDNHFGVT